MNFAVFIQHRLGGFICTVFKDIAQAERHYEEAMEHGARSGFITVILTGQYNGESYEAQDLPLELTLTKEFNQQLDLMEKAND